jgi:hypothetical protein
MNMTRISLGLGLRHQSSTPNFDLAPFSATESSKFNDLAALQ